MSDCCNSGCACGQAQNVLSDALHDNQIPDDTCGCGCGHAHNADDTSLKPRITRIAIALVLFAAVLAAEKAGLLAAWCGPIGINPLYAEFALFLVPYLIAGHDVILKALRNIGRGQLFDENFLMTVATLGAFALVFFPESEPPMAEGAAVMLFYQVGELFQDYAVGTSRKSISEMMDIAPEFANAMRDGELVRVNPRTLAVGDEFVVKPGERIPLDGVVINGSSQIDTAALTGESAPRHAEAGSEVLSGCISLTGSLTVRATRPYADSTVSRVLELVEHAADKKARTESFITRFARYYTPAVVGIAALLAILSPLALGLPWSDWVQRGLIFLVVSCPCALVISVPLSFFGGIGAASRMGVLIKGSNYLEALASVDTVVFDKTGTLTSGSFEVAQVHAAAGRSEDELLEFAALAESHSNHPVAAAIRNAAPGKLDAERVGAVEEIGGHGVCATVDGQRVLVGNAKLMDAHEIARPTASAAPAIPAVAAAPEAPAVAAAPAVPATITAGETIAHVAINSEYAGWISVADAVKPQAREAIANLREAGVRKIVMLTGDREPVALSIANQLGINEVRAELLPQDKVIQVEALLAEQTEGKMLAFVGDGINDAPVLMRADLGIAMGAIGSDAAIEAADIVLMDDKPTSIARAIKLSRRTMSIVWQNIVFALGVKFGVLALAAFGIGTMWLAVFADVGVAVIAILNAMRALRAGYSS